MSTTDQGLDLTRAAKIAELNDAFRTTLGMGKNVTMTPGIAALPHQQLRAVLYHVVAFNRFNADNDPHHEHDFGSFETNGQKVFWKIDYYGPTLDCGSEDPADPAVTTRVLTIMLASEY